MSDDEMNIDDGMYLLLYWCIVVRFYGTLIAVSGGAIRRKGRGFQNTGTFSISSKCHLTKRAKKGGNGEPPVTESSYDRVESTHTGPADTRAARCAFSVIYHQYAFLSVL